MEDNSWQPQWAKLPYLALVRVFAHLVFVDRLSASLVCKDWYKAFSCPDLWRSLSVTLDDDEPPADKVTVKEAIELAKWYGHAFRHIVIECRSDRSCEVVNLRHTLPEFVKIMRAESQLLTFKMNHLAFHEMYPVGTVRPFLKLLADFFTSQRRLSTLFLYNAKVRLEDGLQLLEAAAMHSGSTIREMHVDYLFANEEPVYRDSAFSDLIAKFTNLFLLSLTYTCLSDDVITHLANHGTIRSLIVVCHCDLLHAHTVSESSWSRLKSRCPGIRVCLFIGLIHDIPVLTRILPHSMPLYLLDYEPRNMPLCDRTEEKFRRKTEFLDYIAKWFPDSLEVIGLDYRMDLPVPTAAIENLVRSCTKLKFVKLMGFIPLQLVNFLIDMLLDEQSAVKTLEMEMIPSYPIYEDADRLDYTACVDLVRRKMSVTFSTTPSDSVAFLRLKLNRTEESTITLFKRGS